MTDVPKEFRRLRLARERYGDPEAKADEALIAEAPPTRSSLLARARRVHGEPSPREA